MKFLKNYGQYNSVNEAKATDKEATQKAVLDFLTDSKDICTLASVCKGTKLKTDNVYMALVELSKGKSKSVDHVDVTHYDEHPKRNYPYYYSVDTLGKDEAEEMAKAKTQKSLDDNKSKLLKRKETAKKAEAELEEKSKKSAAKRKDYTERKEKGEVAPKVKKNGEPAKPRGRRKK